MAASMFFGVGLVSRQAAPPKVDPENQIFVKNKIFKEGPISERHAWETLSFRLLD